MVLSISGINYLTDQVAIDATGANIPIARTVKSILIKCVGGQCMLKRDSTTADGDAYVIDDGETLGFNIQFPWTTDVASVNIGFFKAVSGTVTIHVVTAF